MRAEVSGKYMRLAFNDAPLVCYYSVYRDWILGPNHDIHLSLGDEPQDSWHGLRAVEPDPRSAVGDSRGHAVPVGRTRIHFFYDVFGVSANITAKGVTIHILCVRFLPREPR